MSLDTNGLEESKQHGGKGGSKGETKRGKSRAPVAVAVDRGRRRAPLDARRLHLIQNVRQGAVGTGHLVGRALGTPHEA